MEISRKTSRVKNSCPVIGIVHKAWRYLAITSLSLKAVTEHACHAIAISIRADSSWPVDVVAMATTL